MDSMSAAATSGPAAKACGVAGRAHDGAVLSVIVCRAPPLQVGRTRYALALEMRVSPVAKFALVALTLVACRHREQGARDGEERAPAIIVIASSVAPTSASPAIAIPATPLGEEAARCTSVFPAGFPCPEGARGAFDSPEGSRALAIFEIDAPLEAAWSAWIASLARRGFTTDNAFADTEGRAATACRDRCARETFHFGLAVTSHGLRGHVSVFPPVRSGPPPALPGACVPIPQRRFGVQRGDITWIFATTYELDLDRDGRLDAAVPSPGDGGCPGTVAWDLYGSHESRTPTCSSSPTLAAVSFWRPFASS